VPDVNYLAVLNPERLGLNKLVQLRGRIARKGGEGWFSMYLNRAISNQKTIQRLNILVESDDGFYIAQQDMHLRGIGDVMNATTQHGKYVGLIKNAEINLTDVEQILEQV
jgi:ATP-dependent DNA helicase RecG